MGSIPVGISASRSSAILGLSPYQTKTEIWLIMMEQIYPGFCAENNYSLPIVEYNAAMRWGHAFESSIIELVEQKQNMKIVDREMLYQYGELTCHIDGKFSKKTDSGKIILHEGKTTSAYYYRDNFGEPGTDKIPQEYQTQVQHQLICTGAEKVILSVLVFPKRVDEFEAEGWTVEKVDPLYWNHNDYVLHNGERRVGTRDWAKSLSEMGYFHQYEIHPHVELQRLMLSDYDKFWKKNILEKIPPTPETLEDFKRLVRSPVGTIVADENIERWITEKNNIQDEIKSADNRVEQIKLDVLKYCEIAVKVADDDTTNKWIIRSRDGKKLGQYGKNKSGIFSFR